MRPYAFVALVATVVAVGCSSVPAPSPPPAPVGEYAGVLTLGGVEEPARLSLVPGPETLRAFLEVRDRTLASGTADWMDGQLFVGLDYLSVDGDTTSKSASATCAGRVLLVADHDAADTALTGTVRVVDCTGPTKGAFTFTLRSGLPERTDAH